MLPLTSGIIARRRGGRAVAGAATTSTKKGRAGICRVIRLFARRLIMLEIPRNGPI